MKKKLLLMALCSASFIATAQTVTGESELPNNASSTTQTTNAANLADCIPIEQNGVVAVEAESFFRQTNTSIREWFVIGDGGVTPDPDPDDHIASEASGQKYIEVLPDTRVIGHRGPEPEDPLIRGENFSEKPGELAVIEYKINFTNPGKYFVWVRANSSGPEDNGIHVGIDGTWPDSGKRMQWCSSKNRWVWESSQRLPGKSCDNPMLIYLDVPTAGEHIVQFSMREDGFEMDKFILSKEYVLPEGEGIPVFTGGCELSINPFDRIKKQLFITPNPSQDIIKVNGLTIDTKATVYNMLGMEVISEVSFYGNEKKELTITELSRGMYFLKLRDKNNKSVSLKFSKEN